MRKEPAGVVRHHVVQPLQTLFIILSGGSYYFFLTTVFPFPFLHVRQLR